MKEEVVVEVLHHILNQISANILGDCPKIIEKLLEPIQCTDILSASRTLCSVKLLLNLYEKLHLNSGGVKSTLPAEKIFQGIKYLSNNIFLDKTAENDLLSIISVMCKIGATCEIPNFDELLNAYYNDIFREILAASKYKEYNSDQVILLLKILCTLYSGEKNTGTPYLKQTNDEPLLIAHFALQGDEKIATQISLFLVPEFIKFFKSSAPIKYIWTEFYKKNFNYSRILLILCNFFGINLLIDEMNLIEFLAGQINYWELLQYGLQNRDITMKKQAMYLFKKTIDVLSKKCKIKKDVSLMECALEGSANCHWDPNHRDELTKIYSDIIIILEYLDEEQVHIVRPIFEKIEKVVETTIQGDLLSFSWILLIYEIILMHESTVVNKWGIKSLLKLPGKVFLDETQVTKTAILLSSNLNNIHLYYNNGLDVTEALGEFYQRMVHLKTAELFFKTFIKEICKQVWSQEALFFVTKSFSELQELSYWGPEEITEIRVFVSKAFRTYNKTIRNGIQCQILNAVIALSHNSSLPLDRIILLLSKISTSETFRPGHQTWSNVITYLINCYSKENAESVLDLFLNSTQHNEECAALSITLFHHAYEDDFASKKLLGLLSSFENSEQRPYCDVSLLNRYLLTISHLIEKYSQRSQHPKLITLVFPFFEDILSYIHSQIKVISSLKHFSSCELYLKAFESLIKLGNPIERKGYIENFCEQLLEMLEVDLCCKQELSSVQTYFRMRLLKIIYETYPDAKPLCLHGHLLQHVNKLLVKEENSGDMQMIWGKMNSEYFEAKWVILEKLFRMGKILPIDKRAKETNESLLKMCFEGLDVGGYGVLRPIMHILTDILPYMNDIPELEIAVDSVWKIVLERRKTDDFKFCIESFVKMLFQEKLFSKEGILQLLIKYVDLIFSDTSLTMVHTFIVHAEKLKVSDNSMPVLCQILGKGLLFGPVQKKDDKLTAEVCSYAKLFWNCQESENIASSKIRARAVIKLLTIRNKKGVPKMMMDILMQIESEISKKRTRYFGNSFIHRIKTRLMQGVLLLLDSSEKEEKKKIAEWVYLSLMKENPQTSVRNLQEWSLSILFKIFCPFNFFGDAVKKTPKAWCSLITVVYLLAKASLYKIDEALEEILPFCMDQHFETRLYAEVALEKLYRLAQRLELKETVEKYRVVHDCIEKSISRAEGNAAKNYAKLEKHFFFNGFHICTHYSLQTIYYDLPRLANVASDEWIPPEVFYNISVSEIYDLGLNIFSEDEFLQRLNNTEWLVGKSEEFSTEDESMGEVLENYQKKMIPVKPLMPGCSGRGNDVTEPLEKGGLIVVASLIDRIPNLGGLARTCEVFGASQLVLNTKKCMEDKDFKSVSVTAEKWIQVKEVKAESLVQYIVQMKKKGFRVVGAEQAVHSEPLTKTMFPKNCLLVLGNEKTGIPPNLIPLLDVCVEIPQTGIIRSLNVHVTGALFLWEYAKQNVLDKH